MTTDPAEKSAFDRKLDMLVGMLVEIPNGYYAVRPDDETPYSFMRISRPKHGKTRDCTKVQSQHGPQLDTELVVWPSGRTSVYHRSYLDVVKMVVVDFQGAAMTYAQEIGKCCRCNAPLTDERSRWYGIGPECETKPGWEWVIPRIDEAKGSFGTRV